ncbi:transcriptional regulator [Actinomadura graeca]|uniref:Transcriptional regulator n=1 Tax=Actinomadura graeca TaxID=2750812 RepID=A0ABX8QTT2_9ACTN|nr:hypothetical protein [Actinomadura graeca]QXJ22168.1 transcriptional regulator [Actinomadura graeca]
MTADKKAIGARLRQIREAPPYWSRAELARLLRAAADPRDRADMPHVPSLIEMIKQWEAGRYLPNPRYRALYARVTGLTEDDLFAPRSAATRWCPDGLKGVSTPDDEARLLAAAQRPSRIDLSVVDSLAAILAAERRAEDAGGSSPLIEPVRAQLAAVEDMVRGARGPVRRPLLDVAAQWAQFAGWLHSSVDRHDRAMEYLTRTLQWATEVGDQALVGAVMSWQGYVAERRGEIGPMIGLSQAGQRVRQSVGRVYDLFQEARGRALLNEADTVRQLTGTAVEEAADVRSDDARPWEYYYFAPGFFALEHGTAYRILGRTDPDRNAEAVELLTAGLDDLPLEMRGSEWAGDFVHQLGRAYLQAGERDQATRIADELDEMAGSIRSDRLARHADKLR